MQFVQDEPIKASMQDALGFGGFAETIEGALKHTTSPYVFGVIGNWGSGKTSIINLLRERLDSALPQDNAASADTSLLPALVPIEFNAWLYENEANVVYPLLQAIRKDYINRLGSETAKELKDSFLRVAKGTLLALADVGLRATTKHFLGEAFTLKDTKEAMELGEQSERLTAVEAVMHEWTDQVANLQKAFKDLMSAYADRLAEVWKISPDDVRFVIIVDDLDRCLPQSVIQILESIKNFLAAPKTIFVLGINSQVVYQGIRSRYPDQEVDGREYLEKIINYSFYVPAPPLDRAEKFSARLLQELTIGDDARNDPMLQQAFAEFATVLRDSRFNNPRKIKRILNRYLLFLTQHEADLNAYSKPNIVRLIVIAEYFPSLFSLFLSSAQKVMDDLHRLGDGLNPREFEQKWGVPLGSLYRQLITMKDLFRISEDGANASLEKHVEAVFSITRNL